MDKNIERYIDDAVSEELSKIREKELNRIEVNTLREQINIQAWANSLRKIAEFIRNHTISVDPNRGLLICLWTAHCINYQDGKEAHERDFEIVRKMLTDAGYANDEWHNRSRMLDALDKFFVGYKYR